MSPDGVFRTIDYGTSPPTVIDAMGLTPEQISEVFEGLRVPKHDTYKDLDGTKVPREKWFELPEGFTENK